MKWYFLISNHLQITRLIMCNFSCLLFNGALFGLWAYGMVNIFQSLNAFRRMIVQCYSTQQILVFYFCNINKIDKASTTVAWEKFSNYDIKQLNHHNTLYYLLRDFDELRITYFRFNASEKMIQLFFSFLIVFMF